MIRPYDEEINILKFKLKFVLLYFFFFFLQWKLLLELVEM